MNSTRNKIKNRLFYRFQVSLVSPLSISGENSEETDHDVLITKDNKPFISGSSLTGAVYSFLERIGTSPGELDKVFGMSRGNDISMSRIFISDIVFENAKISSRDGIRLNEFKTTVEKAKYDYQVVEPGAIGYLFIEYVLYDNDSISAEYAEGLTRKIISGIDHGLIRFGYKKQRGMGIMSIAENYGSKRFDYSKIDPELYLSFLENYNYDPKTIGTDNALKIESPDSLGSLDTLTLTLDLEKKGGISIRTYTAVPNAPDFSHIQSNEKPVIPASCWNGAIRSRAVDILKNSLNGSDDLVLELKQIWGKIGDKEFVLSQIEIGESIIEPKDNKIGYINMTRNKINRFDCSTVERALYSEATYVGGKTSLTITVRNISKNKWVAGLIILALADIANGLLAVGGQTAIGRGIFSGEKTDVMNDSNSKFISALYDKLKGANGSV